MRKLFFILILPALLLAGCDKGPTGEEYGNFISTNALDGTYEDHFFRMRIEQTGVNAGTILDYTGKVDFKILTAGKETRFSATFAVPDKEFSIPVDEVRIIPVRIKDRYIEPGEDMGQCLLDGYVFVTKFGINYQDINAFYLGKDIKVAPRSVDLMTYVPNQSKWSGAQGMIDGREGFYISFGAYVYDLDPEIERHYMTVEVSSVGLVPWGGPL